ncbi:helix-turn-helix transcriptional regulator [Paenibacillus solani]|uniref:AraC family transcriptional regulator n=1 Tax=Paenibacillus solani TaxID=1705565 RepID=A0A0M1P112_9BACL|nr:AraC family transcriptional regulator [Paenibacillus solani]KOR88072.1 AraC family transcriptional regulator [Paenibacillus solani]
MSLLPDHTLFRISVNPSPGGHDLNILFSGEGSPVPRHKIGPLIHDYCLIHTVLTGQGVFECAGTVHPCKPGDTFIILPGVLFSYEADDKNPWHYNWVALQEKGTHRLLADMGVTPAKPIIHCPDEGELRSLADMYLHLRQGFNQSDHPWLEDLQASGWLRLLFHKLAILNREHLPSNTHDVPDIERGVRQTERWISTQYHQQLSIDQMAKTLGYHRAHLSKMFKQHTGLSPMQYLTKVRIDKAKSLMKSSFSIHEIASSVGYTDPLYFSKQFRKWTGLTPSDYKNSLEKSTS